MVKIAFGQERQLGKAIQIEGLSDSNGIFSAQHVSDGHVFWGAQKLGYYSSTGYDFLFNGGLIETGRWQPWNNEFRVILRKIDHPVPLRVKSVETTVPCVDKAAGYDLMVGDWTPPYGTGSIADVFFSVSRNMINNRNYDSSLSISFSNNTDGFQSIPPDQIIKGCELWLPHLAPESGYVNKLTWRMARIPGLDKMSGSSFYNDAEKYGPLFYRVRSVTNSDGKVISAIYGKISQFQFDPRESTSALIRFSYYLNATENDRNLEYSGENLFKDDGQQYPP
jgi:hypothetical protein